MSVVTHCILPGHQPDSRSSAICLLSKDQKNRREDAVISVAVHVGYMPEHFISGHGKDDSRIKRLPTLPPTENHHALHQTEPRA